MYLITSGLILYTSTTVSTADKDLTCCPVSSVSGCRESGTASGKVKQLLTLRVVHVTHHTPEHPCDRRRKRGREVRKEGRN